MPHLAKVGVCVLFFATGCATLRGRGEVVDPLDRLNTVAPNPHRIEITSAFGSGIYGGAMIHGKWTLEKSGPCGGAVIRGSNAGNFQPTTTNYELPPETFDECRAILESTRFFQMKIPRPDFLFEASGWSITANFNGQIHTVSAYSSGPPGASPGFIKLRDFLDELPKRGKVLSTQGPMAP